MTDSVQIPRRFCGPTDSGHGGYSAAILGTRMPEPAVVSLRVPPPLEQDMTVVARDNGRLELRAGDTLVADAAPSRFELEVPAAPSAASARATRPLPRMFDDHAFENCFACGPARAAGDGLRIFVGETDGRDELLSTTWTPPVGLAANGDVRPEFVWAALDCPSGWAALRVMDPRWPAVLARQSVRTSAQIVAGDEHIIGAWVGDVDGRKVEAGSAIYSLDGSLCAAAAALWVQLVPRSQRTQS